MCGSEKKFDLSFIFRKKKFNKDKVHSSRSKPLNVADLTARFAKRLFGPVYLQVFYQARYRYFSVYSN